MTRQDAVDELCAIAALIKRPPLDDVLLSQDVALRAAEAIGVVLRTSRVVILAAEEAIAWHESEDKAFSKQPPSSDRQWRRAQHQEQIAALSTALAFPLPIEHLNAAETGAG